MTVVLVRELLADATARLRQAGVDSARLDARVLLAHALGAPADGLLTVRQIAPTQAATFEGLVARRAKREPLAYITGRKEFFSLTFEVGPGVLIPRPESETLVEEALRLFPDRGDSLEVLDVGTGSGCLIVAFLKGYPHARGAAVDTSGQALAWTKRNLQRHGLSERCALFSGNAGGTFDVVFLNPPYLTDEEFARTLPEIRDFEPEGAFIAGSDGLASYRELVPQVAAALRPSGFAFIEIGAGQEHAVSAILKENGLELHHSAPDLAGISRCLVAGQARLGRP